MYKVQSVTHVSRATLQFLLAQFHGHWLRIVAAGALMIAGSIIPLPLAWLTRYLIDDVLRPGHGSTLNAIALCLIAYIVVSVIVGVVETYLVTITQEAVVMNLQRTILCHLHARGMAFFKGSTSGYLTGRIVNDAVAIGTFLGGVGLPLIRDITALAVALCLMFLFQWRLAAAVLLFMPLVVVTEAAFVKQIRSCSSRLYEVIALAWDTLHESIAAMELVKGLHAEGQELNKVDRALQEKLNAAVGLSIISSWSSLVKGVVSGLGPLLVLWFGGEMVVARRISLGTLVAFNGLAAYMFSPLGRLLRVRADAQASLAGSDRVCELLSAPPEVQDPLHPRDFQRIRGSVEFQDVWFSYGTGQQALKGIHLAVKPGERVALVGRNGAGKTSLISLIPRFFDPDRGAVRIDGIDIRSVRQGDLRIQIGIVSQGSSLLPGTVMENICYGVSNPIEREAVQAAVDALAYDFITKLPRGFDTEVGQRGMRLSGGERQRISIARILLRRPQIVILDEATSEVDAESEAAIQCLLNGSLFGRTIFLISHRIASVKHADRIVVMECGTIVDGGSHDELYERCFLYRALYKGELPWFTRAQPEDSPGRPPSAQLDRLG